MFSINSCNNSLENYFMEGKTIMGHKCILNLYNQLLSTNCKWIWFLIIKRIKSSRNCFCCTSSFLKGFFHKKTRYGIRTNIWSFFGRLSFISFQRTIKFFFKFLKILRWFELACFLNAIMWLNESYMINPFLACVFGFLFNIGLLWQRIHCIIWRAITLTSLVSLTK